jgi:4-aminobutyrate aminotransferase-like enzyme
VPDKPLANRICQHIIEKGVILFAPVGKATLKICPPLCIDIDAIKEGCSVIHDAMGESIDN